MMRQGIDLWLASWSVLSSTWKVTEPAWAMATVGNRAGVLEYVEIGERLVRETEERLGVPELLRLRAWLARDAHDVEAAAALLHQSIEVARKQGARYFELLAALDLVDLSTGTSEAANALSELQRVYSGFTEGFDFPVLKNARKILEARGARLPVLAPVNPLPG